MFFSSLRLIFKTGSVSQEVKYSMNFKSLSIVWPRLAALSLSCCLAWPLQLVRLKKRQQQQLADCSVFLWKIGPQLFFQPPFASFSSSTHTSLTDQAPSVQGSGMHQKLFKISGEPQNHFLDVDLSIGDCSNLDKWLCRRLHSLQGMKQKEAEGGGNVLSSPFVSTTPLKRRSH